ncbi:MAG: succinyldiaminopimelate transaminase [Gammaproteobacteria bacterium]|nr:MAG: succinyldiaminopimelate transaminase [Gammaproteobacteria bacterium]
MNPDLDRLQPYPFQKLAALKADCRPPAELEPILLSIGEPKQPTPHFITEAVIAHMHGLSQYPLTRGQDDLRTAIAEWLTQRFGLPPGALDPARHVLPVNGTREALFAVAQAVVDRSANPCVLMPNPFYQIYEGAALLAGAEPVYLDCLEENDYLPDFDSVPDSTWARCQILYLCSPGNPTGAVIPRETLQRLIELAQRHDFIICSDECYSEIYADESAPPPGLLQAAAAMGLDDWRNCLVFHSLSKRSNAPGMRSGFVAGDARVLERFHQYRTYHGCAMPPPFQAASIAAWRDEDHVRHNRDAYRARFDAVLEILSPHVALRRPEAGFYLWMKTPVNDEEFARRLYCGHHVTVLPGSYLSRETERGNPGSHHVRIALVPELDECIEAAGRIRDCLLSLQN